MNYGVDVAVFIENIRYWSETNAKIHENFIDGRYWVYYSLDGFSRLYPIWSRDQVKRIIVKCKDAGLLLTADYNNNPYKRTKWYALSNNALDIYGITVTNDGLWRECHIDRADGTDYIGRNRHVEGGESATCTSGEIATSIEEKGEKKGEKEKEPPKPPLQGGASEKKQRKSREPKAAPDWKPERFEGFWRMYPLKKSKQAAIRAWDSLRPEDGLIAAMGRALQRQLASPEWQRKLREEAGQGIPYPASWLNGRRWEDEVQTAQSAIPPPPRPCHTEMIGGEEVLIYDG